MAQQYHCSNERRRSQILTFNQGAAQIQAIDFLEVLDTRDGVSSDAAQRTLLVAGLVAWNDFAAAPITPELISIEGGTRVTPIAVDYVTTLDAFDEDDPDVLDAFDPTEIEVLLLIRDNPPAATEKLLVVRVAEPGDFSNYTLGFDEDLVAADGYRLDPILGQVTFSFKAGCPTQLDCETDDTECAEVEDTTPTIDYLSRDAASFQQLMFDRMAVVLPEWSERSPADIGVTLVELIAYVADHLAYHQDAVGAEAYLQTARKRVSVRRHARLLDYQMHDGCNARAWLAIEVDDTVTIGQGTTFLTRLPDREIKIEVNDLEAALLLEPTIFEAVHAASLDPDLNSISLYTWYDTDCCLPKGATKATVTLPATSPAATLSVGDVLILEEVISPDTQLAVDAAPARRQAVRLTAVEEAEEPLDVGGTVTYYNLTWHDDDALTFPARLGAEAGNYVFRGNVILVDHGQTIADDALVPSAVTARRYRPRLSDTDVTFAVPYVEADALAAAASSTITQDPQAAVAVVTLTDTADATTWSPQRDLLASDAYAREFVVETEDDGRAWIRFGDGVVGAEPAEGRVLNATWRQGNGALGNVGAEAIYHVVEDGTEGTTGLGRITRLRNPLPATGGADPEPIADVRRFAPQAFRTQRRAVTAADYETILGKHPEVSQARARLRFTGSWKTMYVAVDRLGEEETDEDFLGEIEAYLEPYRMMGVDLELRPPQYIGLDILLSVCVNDDYSRAEVMDALLRTFSSRDNADGTRGFFHPDNWTFGDTLYLSKLIAAAMEVDGVNHVFTKPVDELVERMGGEEDQAMRFRRWAAADLRQIDAGYIAMGTYEVLRVANDPTNPERGVIQFNLLGGR